MKGVFRSLSSYNYQLWAAGSLVSNVGTWMQRTAQSWVVLTQLTDHNATAVGLVMALQFGPLLFLLPITGFAADHLDRRKLLITTQAVMGLLALILGILTIAGLVKLWHLYALALLLGCATAFDSPVRQTFVANLVGEADLSNAVALNSTSFNAARMIGPAIAGVLIAAVGSGWVFVLNASSYVAVIGSLYLMREQELHPTRRATRSEGSLVQGFRYVAKRPDLIAILLMLFLLGTFGLNFQLFISAMSVSVFHSDASRFGYLMSVLAIGSIIGALLAAGREHPRLLSVILGLLVFGLGLGLAALMPNYGLFGLALVVVGISAQTTTTTANSLVQLSTEASMRGRVMAILLAVALGGTPLGAPLIGWVADTYGPRWSLGVGAVFGIAAAMVGVVYLIKHRNLRLSFRARRLHLTIG